MSRNTKVTRARLARPLIDHSTTIQQPVQHQVVVRNDPVGWRHAAGRLIDPGDAVPAARRKCDPVRSLRIRRSRSTVVVVDVRGRDPLRRQRSSSSVGEPVHQAVDRVGGSVAVLALQPCGVAAAGLRLLATAFRC